MGTPQHRITGDAQQSARFPRSVAVIRAYTGFRPRALLKLFLTNGTTALLFFPGVLKFFGRPAGVVFAAVVSQTSSVVGVEGHSD